MNYTLVSNISPLYTYAVRSPYIRRVYFEIWQKLEEFFNEGLKELVTLWEGVSFSDEI